MGLSGLFIKAVAKYCVRGGLKLDEPLKSGETDDTEAILVCCWYVPFMCMCHEII